MKRYIEYKKCNIPWVSRIPKHWTTQHAKKMYKKVIISPKDSDEVVTCFRDGTVTLRKNRRLTGFTEALQEIGYQGVRQGDLVIHAMDAFAGAVGVSDSNGKCSPVYSVCEAKGDYNNFYYAYIIREMAKTGFILSLSKGIRQRSTDFRYDTFANQLLPIPPRNEQDKIVNFLDNELAKIDRLLSIKQKQTDILKEIILSLFYNSRKNTKNRIPLKKFATLENNFINIDHDKLYQKLGMYNRGRGIFFRDKTLGIDLGQSSFQNVIPNRLIISGQFAWEGAVSITRDIPSNAIASHRYYLLDIMNDMAVPEYIWAYFMSEEGKTVLNSCSHGAAGRNKPLNIREVLEVEIPLPKMDDQEIIKKKILELEKFRTITSHNIQLLQEFRTRLISDAVTGAIDVSNWKSNVS